MENKGTEKQYIINCHDEKDAYEFSLASLKEKDIIELALNIVLDNNAGIARKNVSNIRFVCDIEENKAKIALEYDTLKRHVKRTYTVDEYGVVDDYTGLASGCLRGVLHTKYGDKYQDALVAKFGEQAVAVD